MTKEEIQAFIDKYSAQREQLNQQMTQLQTQLTQIAANIAAHNGAIEAVSEVLAAFDKGVLEAEIAVADIVDAVKKNDGGAASLAKTSELLEAAPVPETTDTVVGA